MVSSLDTVTEVVVRERVRKYHWPAMQLNFWFLFMLVASSANVGIFAILVDEQNQLELGIPWYFTYWITVGALSLVFILVFYYLMNIRRLLPGVVLLGSFILFVLWLTGLIVISIELWGESGVSDNCNLYVFDQQYKGQSINTLAWLEQRNICQSWQAAWSLELIGTIFLLWMQIMAYQVYHDDY